MEKILKIVFWKCPPRTHLIGLFLTNRICHIFIAPTFLFRMVKTAGLYLVPIKSYSTYSKVHSILKRIVVSMLFSALPENLRINNLRFAIVSLFSHCFFPSASVPIHVNNYIFSLTSLRDRRRQYKQRMLFCFVKII